MKTYFESELEKLEAVNEINHIILMHIADYGAPSEDTLRNMTIILDEVSSDLFGRLKAKASMEEADQHEAGNK
ncbi:MAG: hypothetical protein IKG46_10555 [Solobacterium sp.]|nr:hypothetical protein [Oscillospiraceae bacterium]MBR3358248.1 hypothetical protein [Solobacterium sp.]